MKNSNITPRVSVTEASLLKRVQVFLEDGEFDRADYSKQVFGMFSGTAEPVVLKCRKSLAHIIFDRFGTEVSVRPVDGEYFEVTVKVIASRPFFSWIFQFGGEVNIVSPASVIAEYKELIDNVNNMII